NIGRPLTIMQDLPGPKIRIGLLPEGKFLLQQGEGVQDVLVFIGESSPNMGSERPEIREIGLDYDQVTDTKLTR
ncbi:MAG: hypothetical protein UCJ13_01140, partial [Bacteroidaceae bacterium]|nr:hypothetical protein [Bacteroidaceae bacterium]